MSLEFYLHKFQDLNTLRQNGHNKPHKVCLLLAVMDLISIGAIQHNRIELSAELKHCFSIHFMRLRAGNDADTPENPFFHLRSEGFWHLHYQAGIDACMVDRYSKSKIAYASLDDELFEFFQSSIISADLRLALTMNLTRLPELYQRWAQQLGKSEKTARNYIGAVQGSLSEMAKQHGLTDKTLTDIGSYHHYQRAVTPLRELAEFKAKDARGKAMYSNALKNYGEFLADLGQVDVTADLDEIQASANLSPTEKAVLISTRLGQGRFREHLLQQWQGCAVTGYPMPAMLVASHIKPWRAANNIERLDPHNGLLLLANIDKAFDKGFITFEKNGAILLSSVLEQPSVLGISPKMSLKVRDAHQPYLAYHRERVFAG
ncbi:MAG TPA: restriction endonuclease [Rheinheimera sp.]|uniref:HNH endonuclease n=1 Tax=Rheinheimera sp. TaxID=1869214 RepID=UPI000EBB673E|nr:HNH endonuclease [Rheinheimera sp.]HCU64605.1 restriction endonuclease [Rheinheimera sp.]